MKRLLIWLCFWCSMANSSDMQELSFHSDILSRDYRFTIYLPDNYHTESRQLPVVYLLHGSDGTETDWQVHGHIQSTMDDLIQAQLIDSMIIVMPGHSNSWWANGNDEPAESVLVRELFPYIESQFKVATNRKGRAVAGLSAGGYGALNLALKYPELFAAVVALSPAVYPDLPPDNSSAYKHKVFQLNGKFDPDTWHRLNWTAYIEGYKNQKTKVPMYLLSGDHDAYDIAFHTANLFQSLRYHQPDQIEFRVIDGGHDWNVWSSGIADGLVFINKYSIRVKE